MNKSPALQESKFILYKDENGEVSLRVLYGDETVWLSQRGLSELFDVESNTITYHIKEIYKSQELQEDRTARKIRVVQNEGNRTVERETIFYNLDMIISVGYRVNSQ